MGFYAVVTTMTVALVAAVMVVGVRGAYNEPDWGFQSYLNESFTLPCNHSTLIIEDWNYVEWTLPNKKLLVSGTTKYVLSGQGNITNMYLTITDVQTSDTGVYVCHVYTDFNKGTYRGQLLRGLNLGGHKYREPFDEYRNNLMVAGLAALVLFVPLVTACFVYKFRYQTKDQRAGKHAARLEATKHQRHLEAKGKGAELSEVAVADGKGEINAAYDNNVAGTRL